MIGAVIATVITTLLLCAGEYHEVHIATRLAAQGGSLYTSNPTFVSPFIEAAYAMNAPVLLAALPVGNALGGLWVGHYYVEYRYGVLVMLSPLLWYFTIKHIA